MYKKLPFLDNEHFLTKNDQIVKIGQIDHIDQDWGLKFSFSKFWRNLEFDEIWSAKHEQNLCKHKPTCSKIYQYLTVALLLPQLVSVCSPIGTVITEVGPHPKIEEDLK